MKFTDYKNQFKNLPLHELEVLFLHFAGKTKADLVANPDYEIPSSELLLAISY
jgi:hypothetical protein